MRIGILDNTTLKLKYTMVEGPKQQPLPPIVPSKTFLKQPEVPPRPLIAPKLPTRSHDVAFSSTNNTQLHPLEDDIWTALKPENHSTILFNASSNQQLPLDFIPKAQTTPKHLVGLQQGKVIQLTTFDNNNKDSTSSTRNRQFYELVQLEEGNSSLLLAFQDTGNVFKVSFTEDGQDSFTLSLRDSLPSGSSGKVLVRPGSNELWLIGRKETFILMLNHQQELGMARKFTSHFPEATVSYFLDTEELAVIMADRSIQVYFIPRIGHQQPALLTKLPPIIGDLLKVFKLPDFGYGAVFSDGKMVLWREESLTKAQKYTVNLTLFRIQAFYLDCRNQYKQVLWLGLSNGKLLIVQLEPASLIIKIICEAKWHQQAIHRLFKVPNKDLIASVDSSGLICNWDLNLSLYKRGKLLWDREAEYSSYERVTVRICSWNVAGQSPQQLPRHQARKWLGFSESEDNQNQRGGGAEDILLLSLQEIVDLNARSLNGSSQSQAAMDQWIQFLSKTVMNSSDDYRLVYSSVMVGIVLAVFCRSGLKSSLSSVSEAAIKTGLGGLHGNKGGLVWRAFIFDCPVAFVAVHLAAGQSAVTERNTDLATILRTASLAKDESRDFFAFPSGNDGSRIFDHSAVFVAGDMNYRIDQDRSTCLNQISSEAFEKLQEKDQLSEQVRRKDLLVSYFKEPKQISEAFPPTYKYDRGSVDRFDSSEKARVPAWCDRVLLYCKQAASNNIIESNSYSSFPEVVLSDHKPISATFELKCRKINQQSLSNLLTQIN